MKAVDNLNSFTDMIQVAQNIMSFKGYSASLLKQQSFTF